MGHAKHALLSTFLVAFSVFRVSKGQPFVPILCIFGDSVVDAGNNNGLYTIIKANFPPYGQDFVTHQPTDFTAENLGFSTYPPAYLTQDAQGGNLLIGANFASAGSGYSEKTANLYYGVFEKAVSLTQQLAYYKDYQSKVVKMVGNEMFSGGIHILFGAGSNQCVEKLNIDATSFNSKLNSCAQALQTELPDLKLVIFDIYKPLLDMIAHPVDNGFFEARKACCGTGIIETSLLCNARSVGTCSNATAYVFWDGFHPSEAANQVLAGDLLTQGIPLIG